MGIGSAAARADFEEKEKKADPAAAAMVFRSRVRRSKLLVALFSMGQGPSGSESGQLGLNLRLTRDRVGLQDAVTHSVPIYNWLHGGNYG